MLGALGCIVAEAATGTSWNVSVYACVCVRVCVCVCIPRGERGVRGTSCSHQESHMEAFICRHPLPLLFHTSHQVAIGAEYANPSYAGVDLPFDINQLAVANSVLMGGIEFFRNSSLDPEKRCYPGTCM